MSDRELLELAAKAVGYKLSATYEAIWSDTGAEFSLWNPLTDDGDALRLAVKLECDLVISNQHPACSAAFCQVENKYFEVSHADCEGDPYAATRRAIVRAAAEIGRLMK